MGRPQGGTRGECLVPRNHNDRFVSTFPCTSPLASRPDADAIYHVHAKDTQIYDANLPLTGVLDTKKYTDERNRGWIFRTVGYGHDAGWWREFVSTLRMFGYDGVLSIEHEDSLMLGDEGLAKAAEFLNGIVIREQAGAAWWV